MSDDETAPEMLSRLGTDAMLWAQEFNRTAVKLGYSEMDEGWLIGWFASAIENCDMFRCNSLRAENEKLREALKPFADEFSLYKTDFPDHFYISDLGFTFGQLRAAAAALEGVTEPPR